jgi:hypothetical protein
MPGFKVRHQEEISGAYQKLSSVVSGSVPGMVGLGRFELPTSPLSGVRSNQLSYRPNEANWWSWSGSNRRPPECNSGALPAELQPLGYQRTPEKGSPPAYEIVFEADWTRDPSDQRKRPEVNQKLFKWRRQKRELTSLLCRRHSVQSALGASGWSGTAATYLMPALQLTLQ